MYYLSAKKNESLVEKPTSYEQLLKGIEEWVGYGHLSYTEAWEKSRSFTSGAGGKANVTASIMLQGCSPQWHAEKDKSKIRETTGWPQRV